MIALMLRGLPTKRIMDRDDIIKMAKEAWLRRTGCVWTEPECWSKNELVRFAELVAAAEREKVAAWMMQRGYATGHGDTTEDLLNELEWQIRERESQNDWKPAPDLA